MMENRLLRQFIAAAETLHFSRTAHAAQAAGLGGPKAISGIGRSPFTIMGCV
ncbi:hypothetical protein [Achromobacter agilis]|uniref:Uncharacterized protein n=1 Tax=Achromobacter agilis TaxID=1353888 RepID=A0A446CH65_9BURK|nr:hypothetical protein [Achromobacter agilis]SSW67267.1 hypothetical protein AGI3411_02964 [Achromobacter agilis]